MILLIIYYIFWQKISVFNVVLHSKLLLLKIHIMPWSKTNLLNNQRSYLECWGPIPLPWNIIDARIQFFFMPGPIGVRILMLKCQMKRPFEICAVYGSTAVWTIFALGLAQSNEAGLTERVTSGVNTMRLVK